MTNGDKIRKMSDEELAKMLCHSLNCSFTNCPGYALCRMGDGTANGMVKWLKQEVQENG